MACNRFTEEGLLYLSGELMKDEADNYATHLNECEECKLEVESYKHERECFYTSEILKETPSAAVDNRMLKMCTESKKTRSAPVVMTPMMLFKKYAPVSAFLMLAVVVVGGYVRYNEMNAENLLRAHTQRMDEAAARSAAAFAESHDTDIAVTDSEDADSLNFESDIAQPRTLGDLNKEGVVTVSGQ